MGTTTSTARSTTNLDTITEESWLKMTVLVRDWK